MIFSVKIVMINFITFWFGNIHKRYQNLLKIILVINSTQIERRGMSTSLIILLQC